ncbi:MAG TPA: hypothetical protein VEA69_02660 [Tepidisphaeraceae bacterium]|nr:hypothetical protein [Tepidisphaeraceae bacterium]
MTDAALTRELPCPSCGYDLRAMVGDRCPECGQAVDRAALDVSAIPWAHRRRIGRVRAYLKTARMFTRGNRALLHEQLRPQDLGDARAFARVTGVVLGLLLAVAWVATAVASRGMVYALIAFRHDNESAMRRPGWLDELGVPWSAGMTLPWMMPAAAILLGYHLATVQRTVFRARGRSAGVRRTAVALGSYASAPLLNLVPATMVYALALVVVDRAEALGAWRSQGMRIVTMALFLLGLLLYVRAVGWTALRVGQWVARSTGAGPGRVALAVGELALLWVAGALLFLFVLPWAAGFVRLWAHGLGG